MVPSGWKRAPIKRFCESIIDCVNKTAPVVESPTPFKMIRTTNVRDGKVNTEDVRYVTEDVYNQWIRRGAPKKGDLIFTREAPVGEVGILNDDSGIFLGQRTMMYRVDLSKADNYFIFYSLRSEFCQKQIDDLSNGGTVAHIRVPDCGEIIINIPPLPEQNKIAQILSTWDKAITTTEQLLANSQLQKKALMQQLLTGNMRFPKFNGQWKEGILKEFVGQIYGGGTPARDNKAYWNGQIPWVTVKDLKGEKISGAQETITPAGLDASAANLVPAGTVIIATRMAIGKAVVASCDVVINQDLKAISPSEHITSIYLHYWFLARSEQIVKLGTGSTVKGVQLNSIKSLPMKIPSIIEEQHKIVAVLATADQEVEAFKQKIRCLKHEKAALMQQLLSGKRRVKIDPKETVSLKTYQTAKVAM